MWAGTRYNKRQKRKGSIPATNQVLVRCLAAKEKP